MNGVWPCGEDSASDCMLLLNRASLLCYFYLYLRAAPLFSLDEDVALTFMDLPVMHCRPTAPGSWVSSNDMNSLRACVV
jgi:hypothetical protein